MDANGSPGGTEAPAGNGEKGATDCEVAAGDQSASQELLVSYKLSGKSCTYQLFYGINKYLIQ